MFCVFAYKIHVVTYDGRAQVNSSWHSVQPDRKFGCCSLSEVIHWCSFCW